MKKLVLSLIIISCFACSEKEEKSVKLPPAPVAPSVPVTEGYFGKTIVDPYRNLENLKDSAVLEWFKAEADYTDNILNGITGREALIAKMKEYDEREQFSVTNINVTDDNQYFYMKQAADENVARLFYRAQLDAEEELLYDPKDFKPESGKTYVISYMRPNWDGSYVAVAMTHSGAEISEMIIIDMATKTPLPQVIGHCWPADGGGVNWLADNKRFTYLYYPEIDHTSDQFLKDMKSVLYKVGDDPEQLNVFFSKESHPELGIKSEDFPIAFVPSKNDKYVIGLVAGATSYYDGFYTSVDQLESGKVTWKRLFTQDDKLGVFAMKGDDFIYSSSLKASNFEIYKTSLLAPDFDNPEVLVKEREDETINSLIMTTDGMYYTTTKNGVEGKLYFTDFTQEKGIELPGVAGRVNIIGKHVDQPDLWVSINGWTSNYQRYKFDFNANSFTKEVLSEGGTYPEFDGFVVKEVLVKSHDGAEVPLSIIHKKGIALNGSHSTLLIGYGSYGIPIRPFFSPVWLSWVESGGVWCIAHVRGGGEKGDLWYQGGKKTTKPNTWKDLIACTEYMIEEGYTTKEKTAIQGGSAGGILIGRALTERPDLFGAAIAEVGMMNALRSEITPNGPNNTKEFGTSKDSVECMALIEMDAYLHIEDGGRYPATLITTGMNDPRVIAWQPGKFAARLQQANSSDKPILFSVDYEAGHGIGDTKSTYYNQMANGFAFAFWQTRQDGYELEEK
ncbi:MAG: prolyl oligopeptidase family serine peptidase [Bacteroidota bacterium]